ncbi:MAG TPA: protein kinase [Terriglobales bacterium]|nr:protein kinase [Terriglobales bacterium]
MDPLQWKNIEHLFAAARPLVGENRIAFLKERCGQDDVLFKQVLSLLDIDSKPGLLDSRVSLTKMQVSQIIAGRFRIIRLVGTGGMGDVYEAEDLRLNDVVALKTIRPEFASDPQAVARFKREILLAKKVTHPNVCRIYDLGVERSEDGTEMLFLTMQFLGGETLASRIHRGCIPEAEALPLVLDMVKGLSAAHGAGVIHRDFKSGNVILVPAGDSTSAIITDFGLARAVQSADVSLATGAIGTVQYMAPEQIRGGQATPASDTYALGVVMYEMVTGHQPFTGDSVTVALKHLTEEPQPPRALVPELHPSWERTILRCLKKVPGERFGAPSEVTCSLTGGVASAGAKLGPYEIVGVVRGGPLGEVFRARDARFDRDVAVKFIQPSLSVDATRLQRFEQEARTAAALNHPNILALYDIGTQDGSPYIVSELLEGETLRASIRRGPLPVRKALDYALQIACGIAAAHERGIVHRELKPENIVITRDDRIKIVGFGLSTLTHPVDGEDLTRVDAAAASTIAYMSPEQVHGHTPDARTDLFAFGALVYEMLTGKRAFQGDKAAEVIEEILTKEPPRLTEANAEVSTALDRIVHRCLEKQPQKRFQAARDVIFDVELLSSTPCTPTSLSSAAESVSLLPEHRRRKPIAIAALFGLLIAALSVLFSRLIVRPPQQPSYRQLTFRQGALLPLSAARFTQDGQAIVYSAAWDKPVSKIYASRADGTEVRALDLPESELLAVSRSGELALVQNQPRGGTGAGRTGTRLARAPLAGGTPRELLDDVIAADWSPNSAQLAVAHFENGKYGIEYPIGNRRYESRGFISNMRFSPQGDAIAFMEHPVLGDDRGTVVLVDLKGNKRTLTREWYGELGLAWSPDGKEVWFTATEDLDSNRALYAVTRWGKQRLVLRAPAALYLEDIAPDGRILFKRGDHREEVIVKQIGGEGRKLSWLQMMEVTDVSRDGKFAVLYDAGSNIAYSLYLAKLDGSPPELLGSGIGGYICPDNQWVSTTVPGDDTKIVLLPTGMGEPKTISTAGFHYYRDAAWTSDGHSLVVEASELGRAPRFWVQDITGGPPRALTPEGVDGLFVTVAHTDYVSTQEGADVVRLYPVDGRGPKVIRGVSDLVIGGAQESNYLYVTPDPSAIPLQVFKVNVSTGQRVPFVSILPGDSAGVVNLDRPLFTPDEKRFVVTQERLFSTLYLASGVK